MLGVLFFLTFVILGIGICHYHFAAYPFYVRIWIGSLTGILGLMWGVVPFSFFFRFSVISHVLALLCMMLLFAVVYYFYKDQKPMPLQSDKVLYSLLYVLIPLFLVTAVLLNSHILTPGKDGGLYVGQSTYGDLCLHLGITTSIAAQGTFPPEYSIFPGQRLSYPFLANSLSSSLYLFGTPLRWAILIPSYLMVIMLITGFFLFAYEILRKRQGAVLACILFFFNGGFGFIYFLDDMKKNKASFTRMFTEFYQTPTNLVSKNIRWVNVICDMIIPQRTTLAGWTFLFLVLWLLYKAICSENKQLFIWAGIVTGLMPMIHTHSFMGIGMISMAWCIVFFFQCKNKKQYVMNWAHFAAFAVILSLPQLLFWTFPQSASGGFLKWKWDWANDSDSWLWFWVKNVGIVFILTFPSLVSADKKLWSFYSGALGIFVIAEIMLFQPNPYDNNKLFYIWYAFTVILVSSFLCDLYTRLKGLKGRWLLAIFLIVPCIFSAGLTIAREKVSSYEIFNKKAVAAAEFVKNNTPNDALFITSDTHRNPISSLAGRNVFSGTPVYLNFHGVKYGERAKIVETMYKDPSRFQELAAHYYIDYVYYSSFEKGQFKVEPNYFIEKYPIVFHASDATENIYIFAISDRARNYRAEK